MDTPIFSAVVLAGGRGKRMNSEIPKQYLNINNKPVLYYSLAVLEKSPIDNIVLVVGEGETEKVNKEIIEFYCFNKVVKIVEGGRERYHSVYEGLCALENSDYVLIHDGARPCIDQSMIDRIMKEVRVSRACVVGMPVKDTIKIVDHQNVVIETPKREQVWMVQTPQTFEYSLIRNAYDIYMQDEKLVVTDDAMILECMIKHPVKLIEGSYQNIKITTSEDISMAEMNLRNMFI